MTDEPDLFGKTFDQQLKATGNDIENRDITPNRLVPGEVTFEPVLNGVLVTARDAEHRPLWRFVGSKGMLQHIHCPVAVCDALRDLIGEELEKHGLPKQDAEDPMAAAQTALDKLQETLSTLKGSLDVKKVSDATLERAKVIARITNDADRMICLESASLKGMKQRTDS